MKRVFFFIFVLAGMLLFCHNAYSESSTKTSDGMKPYIPTRLEWLAVVLNSENRTDITDISGFSLTFVPYGENTIMIFVTYTLHTEAMNLAVEGAHKIIDLETKRRGWNSWIKIIEKFDLVNSSKTQSTP